MTKKYTDADIISFAVFFNKIEKQSKPIHALNEWHKRRLIDFEDKYCSCNIKHLKYAEWCQNCGKEIYLR